MQQSSISRRSVCYLLALIVMLIAYGSLYPFHFVRPVALDQQWQILIAEASLWTSFPDVLGNIVLFVPFGILGPECGKRGKGYLSILATLLIGSAFALLIQFAQFCTPERSPALSDALWNTAGIVLGICLWATARAMRFEFGTIEAEKKAQPLTIVVLWFATETAPFVPTFDIQQIKNALKPLLLFPTFSPLSWFVASVGLMTVAELLQSILGARRFIPVFLALMGLVLITKLLIVGHTLSWSLFAAMATSLVVVSITRRVPVSRRQGALFALILTAYVLSALSPFEIRPFASEIHWMPFAARLGENMLANLSSLLSSLFFFSAVLWIVQQLGGRVFGTALVLAPGVAMVELAQAWIVGRTADMTEPFLLLVLAYFMSRMTKPSMLESTSP